MEFSPNFTPRVQQAIKIAKQEAINFSHTLIEPLHLLYGVFKVQNNFAQNNFLSNTSIETVALLDYIKNAFPSDSFDIKSLTYSKSFKSCLRDSFEVADLYTHDYIGIEHLLLSLLKSPDLKFFFDDFGIDPSNSILVLQSFLEGGLVEKDEDLKKPSLRKIQKNKEKEYDKDFDLNNSNLNKFAINFTELASEGKFDKVVCRSKSLDSLIEILCRRTKNNPIILGEAGVGKTALIEGLCQKIVSDSVPDFLSDKQIYSLNLNHIVAGTKYRGQFEERLKNIINEIQKDPNKILFIDEIHTIIGAGSAEGSMDAANILKPMLARGEIKCIGATTLKEYKSTIEKDAALSRRFQSVIIDEPSTTDCFKILNSIIPKYESFHQVKYRKNAIKAAVELSSRYINDRFLPDKAIDIIDEAASRVKIKNFQKPQDVKSLETSIESLIEQEENCSDLDRKKNIGLCIDDLFEKYQLILDEWQNEIKNNPIYVSVNDVQEVISNKTNIPLSVISSSSEDRFLNLDKNLSRDVIGQDHAINSLCNSVVRSACGLNNPNKPLGTFFFLGKTGTGKTLMAKSLSKYLFGDPQKIIRFDMGEFSDSVSSNKLTGSSPGYVGFDQGSPLIDKIKRNPYSVVLFDEIEKAHPDVLKVLLSILDEGRLTDAFGNLANFKNCFIVLTSNIGSDLIDKKHSIGFSNAADEDDLVLDKIKDKISRDFSPEFLNRIDDIILFKPFSDKDYNNIIKTYVKTLNLKLKNKKVKIILSKCVVENFIKELKKINLGARPVERLFRKDIETLLSKNILNKKIQPNSTITFKIDKNNKLSFSTIKST